MFPEAAPNSLPKPVPRLSRQQRLIPITHQILIAVLLFDLAGAGMILGLGEAQAGQRRSTALSSQVDIGPHLPEQAMR